MEAVPLTTAEVLALPAVVDLVTAARALGMGRTTAYGLVRAGEFPCRVLRVGRGYRVPTAELLGVLGFSPSDAVRATDPSPSPGTREPTAGRRSRRRRSRSSDGSNAGTAPEASAASSSSTPRR